MVVSTPTVLSIAGFDPYGGAGIVADCKTIHALGGYALSSSTAVTAQNSCGVSAVQTVSADMLKLQLETLLDDVKVDAVKIGMLGNGELISVVAECIEKYNLKNIVLDTVLVSSSGKPLLEKSAVRLMETELFPKVDLITPNVPEINTFLKTAYCGAAQEVQKIAIGFFEKDVKAVLLKGGHSTAYASATDYLVTKDMNIEQYSSKRVVTTHTHGTGCILSSAVAMGLAKGLSLHESVAEAKVFLYDKLQHSGILRLKYVNEIHHRKEPLF